MKRAPSSNGPVIAAIVLAPLLMVMGYLGTYYWLGEYGEMLMPGNPVPVRVRHYKYQWMVDAFRPMARLESAVTGAQVWVFQKDRPVLNW